MRNGHAWRQLQRLSTLPSVTPMSAMAYIKQQWPDLPMDNLECDEVTSTRARLVQRVPSRDIRPGGFISGPCQFAMADVGMWVNVFGAKGLTAMAMTSEMSIRFLRPATGDTLKVETQVNSVGSRSIVMTATLWTGDNQNNPCSVAQGTYVMPRPR